MIGGIGGYGGSTSAGGFGGFGSPEGMAEAAVASGAMSEAEAYGGFDTPETDAIEGGSGGGSGNLMGNYAAPTGNFQSGVSIAKQVDKNNIFANAVKAAMNLTPTRMAMSLLARTGDLTPTMSFMADDPRAMNAPITTAGIPGYLGQNYGVGTITDVAMSGSGAHMAPATSIQNWGGQDVHVGPGYQMNMAGIEDGFFPGYGVNPYSGVAMADPSDPYIRKNRGSEIVAMIGA